MPARILIADDDRAIRESLQRALELEGYAVLTAADGTRALAAIEAARPDLLGAAIQTVPDLAAAANPITYIATAKSLPVFSIAHGDSDCLVPNQQSAILQDALQAAGANSTFTLVEGAAHGDQAITSAQTPVALEMLASVFGK